MSSSSSQIHSFAFCLWWARRITHLDVAKATYCCHSGIESAMTMTDLSGRDRLPGDAISGDVVRQADRTGQVEKEMTGVPVGNDRGDPRDLPNSQVRRHRKRKMCKPLFGTWHSW
ncbi:hypothetical protein ACRALDRAFT_2036760 [Sodiomyces alcalophilus JCM 7366]|uniref:uncharacterized protein n=1 Tax=Sodiomyces alcalophilus JCM 7366 TaxID=591952 RepID=UPI0039B508E7